MLRAQTIARRGLDQPVWVRYLTYLVRIPNVCRSSPRRAVSGRSWRAQFPYTPSAAFTGTGSNGDVARLASLVLGRSKAERSGLVFATESGTAVDSRSALRAIRTAAKALGMSGVGQPALRGEGEA